LIKRDEIHIHILSLNGGSAFNPVADFLSLLTLPERRQYGLFGSENRHREFLGSRLLVRWLLAGYLEREMGEIQLIRGKRGKLFVENSTLQFNFYHTDRMIVCSVGRRPLGIDVEKIDSSAGKGRPWPLLAERYFSPEEYQILFSQPSESRARAFFKIFTMKEAYIKALGLGLSLPLSRFTVPVPPQEPFLGPWEFFTQVLGSDEYCLAHAVHNPDRAALEYRIYGWNEERLAAILRNTDSWDGEAPTLKSHSKSGILV